MNNKDCAIVISIVVCATIAISIIASRKIAAEPDGIEAYCGDTYTLDVSPLRTKVSCRGEEFVIFPNVDEMSPEEFRDYREARDKIPIGLKNDLMR